MIDPANVPPIENGELLACYVFASNHIIKASNTIKPEALLPRPNHQLNARLELSVTRHLQATTAEVVEAGVRIGQLRTPARTLKGRVDFTVEACRGANLEVIEDAIPNNDPSGAPENPNHAVLIQWPAAREEQIEIAQDLLAAQGTAYFPQEA